MEENHHTAYMKMQQEESVLFSKTVLMRSDVIDGMIEGATAASPVRFLSIQGLTLDNVSRVLTALRNLRNLERLFLGIQSVIQHSFVLGTGRSVRQNSGHL